MDFVSQSDRRICPRMGDRRLVRPRALLLCDPFDPARRYRPIAILRSSPADLLRSPLGAGGPMYGWDTPALHLLVDATTGLLRQRGRRSEQPRPITGDDHDDPLRPHRRTHRLHPLHRDPAVRPSHRLLGHDQTGVAVGAPLHERSPGSDRCRARRHQARYRNLDVAATHNLATYASVGTEVGVGRARLRFEARDGVGQFKPLRGVGDSFTRNDVVAMVGLRLVSR